MISKRDVALRLDIPLEMANRHGIPARMSEEDLAELEQNPPAWLVQSRANRTKGARPVWVELRCDVCGHSESVRPKKWWPEFNYLSCDHHSPLDIPEPVLGYQRREIEGIGTRFVGIVDEKP